MKRLNITAEQYALDAFSSDSYLQVNWNLLKKFGPDLSVFISNLINKYKYFKDKDKLVYGNYFFQKHAQQMEVTGLTSYKLQLCKSACKEKEILKTIKKGVPCLEYYTIYWEVLVEIIKPEYEVVRNSSLSSIETLDNGTSKDYIKENIIKENKEKIKRKILFNFLSLFPEEFQKDKTFQTSINEYITHRKEKGKTMTELSCQKLAKNLSTFPIPICIEAINKAIENGWTGVFPESVQQRRTNNSNEINASNRSRRDDTPKMKYKE